MNSATTAISALSFGDGRPVGSRFELLRVDLRRYLGGGLVIALSGGVDSSFLAWTAEKERNTSGGRLLALTTSSDSLATAERDDVDKFVRMYEVPHIWCESGEFDEQAYLVNDVSRCYHCKTELFRICGEVAVQR